MARFRLKEDHPTMKVLDEVLAKLEELGVRFELPSSQAPVFVTIGEHGTFELVDADNNESVDTIPPTFEFKVCYDRVTEEEKAEAARREQERLAAAEAERKAKEAAEQKRREEEAARRKAEDLSQLRALAAKWPGEAAAIVTGVG